MKKGRFRDSPRAPKKLEILARQRVAVKLRIDGANFEQIAARMKKAWTDKEPGAVKVPPRYEASGAYRDVNAALEADMGAHWVDVAKLRTIEDRRANRGYSKAIAIAEALDASYGEQIAALKAANSFSERLAALHGLDAPKTFTGVSLTPEQLAAMSDEELDALRTKLAR